jgi:hypothetical protein
MSDPMVKDEQPAAEAQASSPTKIPVFADSSPVTVEDSMMAHESEPEAEPAAAEETTNHGSPAVFSDPQDEPSPAPLPDVLPNHPESVASGPFTEAEPQPPAPLPEPELPTANHEAHIEGLHFAAPKRRRSPAKIIILAILLILVAGYLLIDSGTINPGFTMPFHVFKQETPVSTSNTPAIQKQPAVQAPATPAGFKEYKISGTTITFAAPTAWGDPTSTTDTGYSKRSAGAQPDGIYAYLVNFSANKDIQIAVTSSKFLPATRGAQYYDFLQWCTGTNDGQVYQSVLNFSTANKVDTPTTVTCSVGPLSGVTKIDDSSIVQAKAADSTGKVAGDIYTKNLTSTDLVVFRVKDGAMANSSDIKQLLGTVKVSGSTAVSASSQ